MFTVYLKHGVMRALKEAHMGSNVLARGLLALCVASCMVSAADLMGPRQVNVLPTRVPDAVVRYGAAPQHFGQLRLPAGEGPFPVAVVIHGGCFTKGFAEFRNTAPLASALARRGIATWNIECRQLGDPGGGWPGTFLDWGAATDALREIVKHYPLDLRRVITVGHSAGATAALWVAARPGLPAASEIRGADPLRIAAAVAIDGPADLAAWIGADAEICGNRPVVVPLMGGTPSEVPRHYREGSPRERLPLGLPQLLVSSSVVLPKRDAEAYRDAAQGDDVRVVALDAEAAGHFNMIAPGQAPARQVEDAIVALVRELPGD